MSKFNFILLIIPFIFIALAHADTLYLKNGRSIEGLIKSEDNDSIELEVYGGTVKFRKSEIENIRKSTLQESMALRQRWERQKKEYQQKLLNQQLEEESKPKKIEFSGESQNIILEAIINKSVKASLILDTGATMILLRKNIAEKLGINLDGVEPDLKARMADGRQVNAKFIVLESVKVQDVEANNVEASVLLDEVGDIEFGDGLLGMSFLKRFNFKVDQKEKKLILEKL